MVFIELVLSRFMDGFDFDVGASPVDEGRHRHKPHAEVTIESESNNYVILEVTF